MEGVSFYGPPTIYGKLGVSAMRCVEMSVMPFYCWKQDVLVSLMGVLTKVLVCSVNTAKGMSHDFVTITT